MSWWPSGFAVQTETSTTKTHVLLLASATGPLLYGDSLGPEQLVLALPRSPKKSSS